MRFLLLIPNFILIAVSAYNLTANETLNNDGSYFPYTLLHLLVMLICILFVAMVIKSAFAVKYTETAESIADNAAKYNAATI